jgi:hypothetical protein
MILIFLVIFHKSSGTNKEKHMIFEWEKNKIYYQNETFLKIFAYLDGVYPVSFKGTLFSQLKIVILDTLFK